MLKRISLLLLIAASFGLMAQGPLVIENNVVTEEKEDNTKKICPNKSECQNVYNKKCKCYCSHECGPREKRADEDNPVYVENDPYGNYCYCKPWDQENVNRCMKKPTANQTKNK